MTCAPGAPQWHSAYAADQSRDTLEVAGTPSGLVDQLIAGIALAHKRTVITRNLREFARVPGLRGERWCD